MKISGGVFQGTVAAGDGVVFRMQRPCREAVDGDVASFFTRKALTNKLCALGITRPAHSRFSRVERI